MAILGIILRAFPPERINNNFGYRSPSAMKNKDTWSEGNRFCGLILICSGAIFITFSILVRYLYNNNLNFSMRVSVAALAMILMGNIIFTEIHLRKLFDKNGIRKR
ncbi:SdpI family protein [Candidatus Clostridium radicumherbarum]|uniref:SdpI family protein n=1 Tax=Candidatus Clostridium radicumherbarum TaxID=3381662 RepID=A0ABW8TRH1_9CLOT